MSNNRSNRVDARRREILRAAAHAFRRQGFAAAGMRDVAAEARLSPANLYYYFRSKEDLLAFCQEHSLDRLLEAGASVLARRETYARKLERLIREHVALVLDELDGAAAHLEVDALPPPRRRRIVERRDRYERLVRGLIARGIASGELAPGDPALLARAVLGMLNSATRWYSPEGDVPAAEIGSTYARLLVKGLGHETAAAPEGAPRARRERRATRGSVRA